MIFRFKAIGWCSRLLIIKRATCCCCRLRNWLFKHVVKYLLVVVEIMGYGFGCYRDLVSAVVKMVKLLGEVMWLCGGGVVKEFLLKFEEVWVSSIRFEEVWLSLSGASMAISFASVTGFTLLRAMFVLLLVSIPLAIIWVNTKSILAFVGQDAAIAAKVGQYARFMIPIVFAYGLLQCLIRFLQTQNIVFPMMLSYGITTLIHIILCWILVLKSGLGNRGAALANSISYWINVLFHLYVKFSSSCAKILDRIFKGIFAKHSHFS
ncbi:hypothetical protein FEM48_Zijuj05G0097100 [Ziziphus jujuba var. spinosa]|uniref:Uncharacterized protein n=1 Tax=Ziziphus jujuba var. spinosa TaxID=714518 RepID=A0A978VE85_ZIZJJ|nr:hypothetical protein FEM48_Zijuj05G0097100 [Ziziphus jujuba var. spinosa]